jgi:tRNA 2-thiouridine synthesizing protein A
MNEQPTSRPAAPGADHAAVLDVGDMLCGELALLLRRELKGLPPGQVLKVVARDPAAPQDIPAWCELTGHAMLRAEPPQFWIRRRQE